MHAASAKDGTHAPPAGLAPGATARLAEFCAALTFEQIPKDVVDKAKLCILDSFGCMIFGASLPSVRRLEALAASEGSGAAATVFGSKLRTSAPLAALVNGTSAHAFQLDEIHIESTLHPGSLALPAAFALAETADGAKSGRDLITALVAGYEVGLRVGLACKGGMFKSGLHNQGTTGVFVAAAAAARLLRLDAQQTRHALGIAASQAAGLMAVQDGAMTKAFHSGRAAQSGVYGALLARSGYTGIPDVLDGAYGTFFSAFLDDWSPQPLTEDLGSRWHTLRVGFKPAPASNGSITAMSAINKVMQEHGLKADDIDSITAFVSDNTLHHCGWPYEGERIQSVLSAQMNLRYGIAVMALEGRAGVEQFADSKIRDPDILKFIARIVVEHEPQFEGQNGRYRVACRLVVRTKSGKTYASEVLYRKGSPEDPMTGAELREKFDRLSGGVGAEQGERIARTVAGLDDVADLSELSKLLAAAK
jgi:2-methylcitrate dehydratase PrpD